MSTSKVIAEFKYNGEHYAHESEWKHPTDLSKCHNDPTNPFANGLVFMWTEGNYGCDCNRASFLDLPEMNCTHEILMTKLTVDGEEVPLDGYEEPLDVN